MHHRNWLAPLVLGLALAGAASSVAEGGGLRGGGFYGGYSNFGSGVRSVNSFRNGNRLYRHRSGYLYGQYQPYAYPQFGGGYACGGGYPVVVQQAPTADQSCGVYLDPRQDFDCRRDRLLQAATRIDVSYLEAETSGGMSSTDGPGWVFLREGEPTKALGRFTARLMKSPGDGTSQIGYALAAAMLGDDASAAAAMEDVIRTNPRAIREFANAENIDRVTRDLLARYAEALDADPAAVEPRLMTVALHAIRDEPDAARAAIAPDAEDLPGSPAEAVAQRD